MPRLGCAPISRVRGRPEELRTFLSMTPAVAFAPHEKEEHSGRRPDVAKPRPKPRAPKPEPSLGGGGGGGRQEGLAADLLRRSGRGEARGNPLDPADTKLLTEAMAELHKCWAGKAPSGEWKVQQGVGGVSGLAVCTNFLNEQEVEALRTLIGAHRTWAQYSYDDGRQGALASVVQRIDFGPAEMRPEGMVGGSPMWRLGHERAEVLTMVGDRLRHVFAQCQLWHDTQPDTVQLTKIGSTQRIANHWDRRDKWLEGIASVAWSELPCEKDLRGEAWSLRMEIGSGKEKRSVRVPMLPGSAYILMGPAQGCTRACKRKAVGHGSCSCCWTHGVDMEQGASVTRHSMTLRVLAEDEDSDEDDEEENAAADEEGEE